MDWYLEDPRRLKGQPKRTIAEYVESNGILVPVRFDSLQEAKKSGLSSFLRSESTLEYDGPSGLLDSLDLHGSVMGLGRKTSRNVHLYPINFDSINRFKDVYFKFKERFSPNSPFITYCKLAGINYEEFKEGSSFSLWQRLFGIKRTVVADSSIRGRYHIQNVYSSDNQSEKSWNYDYFVLDNGKLEVKMHKSWNFPELKDSQELVDLYEQVRNLPRFDKNNCPIMEMISVEGQHYFLQYHRGRQFKESNFVLDRPMKNGEFESLFVRGHTGPEGIVGEVTAVYHQEWDRTEWDKWTVPEKEFGSFNIGGNFAFSQLMQPRRRLQLKLAEKNDAQWELLKFVGGHDLNSLLYSPEISIITDMELFRRNNKKGVLTEADLAEMEYTKRGKKAALEGKNYNVRMLAVSDGRRAYLQRLS